MSLHSFSENTPIVPLPPIPAITNADGSLKKDDDTHGDGDSTLRGVCASAQPSVQECCLVQIYPADVVSGMLLLECDRLVIGRDAAVDLQLADGSVSRQHAELLRDADGYRLRDLGSTNGSTVNGEKVTERKLRSGDTIQIGSFIFKFLSAGSIESKYHEAVYSAMTRDALTGAMNKRYLMESLRREVARSMRQSQSLSLLMMDIDHFKLVNDTHGHLVGDEVLREFGRRILDVCREDDLFARYGGEEFSLMLCATGPEDAAIIAERCRAVVADETFATSSCPLAVTTSIGLMTINADSRLTAEELIHAADEKLYLAKRSGRNRVIS